MELKRLGSDAKRVSDMTDPLVLQKADAAALWAHIATQSQSNKAGEKPWAYLLVPETAVLENATLDGLVASHTRSVDLSLGGLYEVE